MQSIVTYDFSNTKSYTYCSFQIILPHYLDINTFSLLLFPHFPSCMFFYFGKLERETLKKRNNKGYRRMGQRDPNYLREVVHNSYQSKKTHSQNTNIEVESLALHKRTTLCLCLKVISSILSIKMRLAFEKGLTSQLIYTTEIPV